YVHNWGFKNSGWTALTAAIFNLGVRGLITIRNENDTLSVTRTGKALDEKLPVGEEILFRYFEAQQSVTLDKAHGVELGSQREKFTSAITRENRAVWFNHNAGFAILSFVLAALMMVGMVALDILEPVWLFGAFVGGVFVTVIGSIFFSVLRQGGWQRFIIIIFLGFFGFNFLGGLAESFTDITINTAAVAAAS